MREIVKSVILEQNQAYTNRWIVSYADFTTMLLALFMVLYGLSQFDLKNMNAFANSVNKAFYTNSISPQKISKININLDKKSKIMELFSTTKTTVYLDKQSLAEPDPALQESAYFENLKQKITKEINNEKINVIKNPEGLIIRLNDRILFAKDSDIIKNKSFETLNKIAGILRDESNSIKIESHTDDIFIKSDKFSSNWELSAYRATNLAKYFIEEQHIRPDRILTAGCGEYVPIADNKTPEGRSENSRVDIIIMSGRK